MSAAGGAGTSSVGSDRGPHEERGGAGRGHRRREPVEGVKPAKLSSVSKVAAYIREAALEPGTTVAVVSMVGSLCPVTLAHVQAFEEARAVLLGSRDGFPRPAGLEPFSSVVGLAVLNGDRFVGNKLARAGARRALNVEERGLLVTLATEHLPWLQLLAVDGRTAQFAGVAALRAEFPRLTFSHFQMNGADDVVKHSKWCMAGPDNRMITMGRPGATERVLKGMAEIGLPLDSGDFVMGPELPDISSTEVRAALDRRDAVRLRDLLHPRVMEWCLKHY